MKSRIIYGTSRKRNTQKCLAEVNSFLRHGTGENLHIIVPEQYSSYYEQLLVENSIEHGSFQAEVLTFKRLAHRIFTKNLCGRANYIDNAGKSMLMYDIINSARNDLKAFSRAAAYPAFAIESVRMIKEFKRYGLSSGEIFDAAQFTENHLLSSKLRELSQIYSDYSKRLAEGGFSDADDDMATLAKQISETDSLKRSIFWVDLFDGFTPAEILVVKALIDKSLAVSFILCMDTPESDDEDDIFRPVRKTAANINDVAGSLGMKTEMLKVKEDRTFSGTAGELEHLGQNYFKYPWERYADLTQCIKMVKADSIYTEVERCAIEISRRVRENRYRYGEICVVSGLYEEYESYIESVFSNYDIPVFLDEKRPITRHPASLLILSMLDIYLEKYSYESVFSFLKSPYSDFDEDEVSKLENYIIEFDIKGVENWNLKDWEMVPYKNRDRSEIKGFNKTRRKLIEILEPLFSKMRYGIEGEEFSRLIFDFIKNQQVYEKIKSSAEEAAFEGRLEYSDELKQSFNILMDILDQIKTVAEGKKLSIDKYRDMLAIAFSEKKIGLIPPRTDVVFAGRVSKAFGNNIKMLMVLGTNDPGFPEPVASEGLFTDKERNDLKESGFEIAPNTITQVIDRQINIYNMLNLPDDFLYVSWSMHGTDGTERNPSSFVTRVRDIFPGIKEETASIDGDDCILTPVTGLITAMECIETNPRPAKWYIQNGFERFFSEKSDSITDEVFRSIIAGMLGDVLEISPTAMENYAYCPYKYFAKNILNADERREFSISAPDVGSILHDLLKVLVSEFSGRPSPDYSECMNTALSSFEKMRIYNIFGRNSRMKYLGDRIVARAVDAYGIARRQIDAGKFIPVEYEASFGRNRALEAPCFDAGESRVYLKGRIDRVDAALLDDGEYFRIIDYKSSGRDPKLYKIKEGLEIQLPLYLMAYMKYSGTKPGGMYYFDASKRIVNADYDAQKEDIENTIQKEGRLSGYTLNDKNIVRAMDMEMTNASSNINVNFKKDGTLAGKLISADDLAAMTDVLEKHIIDNTKAIYNGNYEVYPVRYEKKWACDMCGFKGICGFDKNKPGCKYRSVIGVDDKDLDWNDGE